MSEKLRKVIVLLMLLTLLTTSVIAVSAANFGIPCVACHEYDYMSVINYEQVGIGGTMYIITYRCSNCGGATYQVFNAR